MIHCLVHGISNSSERRKIDKLLRGRQRKEKAPSSPHSPVVLFYVVLLTVFNVLLTACRQQYVSSDLVETHAIDVYSDLITLHRAFVCGMHRLLLWSSLSQLSVLSRALVYRIRVEHVCWPLNVAL